MSTYIVNHRQTCFVLPGLFSVDIQARFPKQGSKLGLLKRQSKILPLSHEETCANEGNVNAYVSHLFLFTYIRLTATESSSHMKSLALRKWQPFSSLARELNPTGLGEHIYWHPQTDLLRSIRTFSVAGQTRFPKLGSKPSWLKRQWVRVCVCVFSLSLWVFCARPNRLFSLNFKWQQVS